MLVFGKDLTYMFLWNSGDSDGGGSGPLNLEQAWVKWKFADQMAVRGGQIVNPVIREQLTASQYAERLKDLTVEEELAAETLKLAYIREIKSRSFKTALKAVVVFYVWALVTFLSLRSC